MTHIPQKALLLAAGKGERMRPLTDSCPKPLLKVAGQTMLDRAVNALEAQGVKDVVINTWYLGEMIETQMKKRKSPRIHFSRETELLDTGGGALKALPLLGNEAFYALNADVVWEDGKVPMLQRLAQHWDESKMDLLLLMQPLKKAPGHIRGGDYILEGEFGRPVFGKGSKDANVIFAGPRIVHPRLFAGEAPRVFSFIELFHKAERAGRLYGLLHDGALCDVGTPEALAETNKLLSA